MVCPFDDHSQDESFFWRARTAYDVLHSVTAMPTDRVKATKLWANLYRVVHSSRDETGDEHAKRITKIDAEAAKAGLSPILFHLREFALDIAHAELARDNKEPLETRGRPRRDWKKSIEIAGSVERLRGSTTREEAFVMVAETTFPAIGADAVKTIYETATRTKAGKSLVRLVAGAEGELTFKVPT
jgi:hypothetical protein